MKDKLFTKNDDSFVCVVCGKAVDKLGYTSRNHCNACLSSLHVDESPGDRASRCGGIMKAVSALPTPHGFTIIFKCQRCGAIKKNKAATDDDTELLIRLTARPISTTS